MIIGSLLEKEGLDEEDKKQISSVIFNRLDKKMKANRCNCIIHNEWSISPIENFC